MGIIIICNSIIVLLTSQTYTIASRNVWGKFTYFYLNKHFRLLNDSEFFPAFQINAERMRNVYERRMEKKELKINSADLDSLFFYYRQSEKQ